MQGTTFDSTTRPSRAAAYIERDHATIAMTTPDGEIVVGKIVGAPSGDPTRFLIEVVRRLGARDRLYVAGHPSLRIQLERDYVSFFGRPDSLTDVPDDGRIHASSLVDRVRRPYTEASARS